MRLALAAALLAAAAPTAADGRAAALSAEARRLYDQGQYEAALQAYQQALLEDPARPELRYNEGSARYKTGDLEAALQTFRQLSEDGDAELAVRSRYNAGNALYRQQDYAGAADAYVAALERAPDDPDARANLELSLRRLKEEQSQTGQGSGKDGPGQDGRGEAQPEGPSSTPPAPRREAGEAGAGAEAQRPRDGGEGSFARDGTGRRAGEPAPEGMNPVEAARLLDALEDRDRQAQFRRFRVPDAAAPARDW